MADFVKIATFKRRLKVKILQLIDNNTDDRQKKKKIYQR